MNETIQLLQDVARSARSGKDAVERLLARADSDEMRTELSTEREEYRRHMAVSEQALAEAGSAPSAGESGGWAALSEKARERSNADIAQIVIRGATLGVIEMTRAMDACADADADARRIASSFIVSQSAAIDRQKAFLGG